MLQTRPHLETVLNTLAGYPSSRTLTMKTNNVYMNVL